MVMLCKKLLCCNIFRILDKKDTIRKDGVFVLVLEKMIGLCVILLN